MNVHRGLRVLAWLTCCLPCVLFVVSVALRLRFPYEYDWIEDGVLASVRHMRTGQPLYGAPSVSFTPFLYTPVYFWLADAVSHITGVSYATLRGISVAATCGCFAVLAFHVWRETREALAAFIGLATFASLYQAAGCNFDIGRVDMLYLLWVLGALFATRERRPVLASVLWVIAFQTKQGVAPTAFLAMCTFWPDWRKLLIGLGSFAGLLLVSIALLWKATGGWYGYYVFHLVGGFGFDRHAISHMLQKDLLTVCGAALVVIVAAYAWPPRPSWATFRYYALTSLGMIGFTLYLRAHRGANVNSLLPMYAWIALEFGCACGRLFGAAELLNPETGAWLRSAVSIAAVLQLLAHYYSPREITPGPDMLAQRNAFEGQLRSIPGDVLVIGHPEDGFAAGKSLFASSEAIGAVIDAKERRSGDDLIAQYQKLLQNGRLRGVVLDKTSEEVRSFGRVWLPPNFDTLYPLRVAAIGSDMPTLGSEPVWIYLPCSQAAAGLRLNPALDTSRCSSAPKVHSEP